MLRLHNDVSTRKCIVIFRYFRKIITHKIHASNSQINISDNFSGEFFSVGSVKFFRVTCNYLFGISFNSHAGVKICEYTLRMPDVIIILRLLPKTRSVTYSPS